jgi:hypothetical protein
MLSAPSTRQDRLPRIFDAAILLSVFAAARVVYLLLGLKFDASPFPGYMQFIDRALLEGRLLESLWFYHAHPPGLNLLVGLSLKLFGDSSSAFLAFVFHLAGFGLIFCVFALTLRIAGSRVAAYACAAVLALYPAFVLYENWLMYTFPAAALLAGAAFALMRYLDTERTRWALAFFSLLAALALTRSVFHIVWFVALTALVAVAWRGRTRQILVAALVPFLVTAGWYAKNYYYFGSFSVSSMLGLGLSNVTTLTLDRETLLALVDDGTLSPFAVVSRYTDTAVLFSSEQLEPTGVPVLDEVRKSTGEFNFNNRQIVDVNRYYTHDAFEVMRRFPANYAIGVVLANRLFFSPSSMNEYFTPANRAAARPLERVFDPLLFGVGATPRYMIQPHFGFDRPPSIEVDTSFVLVALWVILLGYAYVRARAAFLSTDGDTRVAGVVLGFILVNSVYVYLVSTLFELGENYRYKFIVEPLLFAVAAAALAALLRRARSLAVRGKPTHS